MGKSGYFFGQPVYGQLIQDNTLSAAALAERIGITAKAVEKQIGRMRADGVLQWRDAGRWNYHLLFREDILTWPSNIYFSGQVSISSLKTRLSYGRII